jgi:DMSO/TMAO reductase YedYZ heme-binding membrane subunit
MRRLGKNWRRLHRVVYLIAILVTLHFWMLSKHGNYDYFIYFIIVSILLGWRVWFYLFSKKNKNKDDGMETIERVKSSKN